MNPLRPFLPSGLRPCRILFGYFSGVRAMLNLRCEFQHYLGLYEAELHPWLRRLAGGARSLVDLGAAKGELPIRFLLTPGVERVVAVDPSAPELAQFEQNRVLNKVVDDPRLVIHAGFAGSGEGPEWRTLDQLGEGLPAPVFLKIDIDGPEAEVLQTGPLLLARDCRVLIETHSLEAETRCLEILRHAGYETRVINPAWWRCWIREHRPIPHNRWLVAWRGKLLA